MPPAATGRRGAGHEALLQNGPTTLGAGGGRGPAHAGSGGEARVVHHEAVEPGHGGVLPHVRHEHAAGEARQAGDRPGMTGAASASRVHHHHRRPTRAVLEYVSDLRRYREADHKITRVHDQPDVSESSPRSRARFRGRLRGLPYTAAVAERRPRTLEPADTSKGARAVDQPHGRGANAAESVGHSQTGFRYVLMAGISLRSD